MASSTIGIEVLVPAIMFFGLCVVLTVSMSGMAIDSISKK